jgi:hypothetical protein
LASSATALNAHREGVVEVVLPEALEFEVPIGVEAWNSPAGTRATVAVHCSLNDGVNVLVPADQLPVATVYQT